jgi:hypothetical protein
MNEFGYQEIRNALRKQHNQSGWIGWMKVLAEFIALTCFFTLLLMIGLVIA